jgi:PST family polysaccharide transporter
MLLKKLKVNRNIDVNLIRTSLWSGVATIFRVFIGFFLNKILAVYVGPSGVALLGQFSNYSGMLTAFGNGGINAGVTKFVAEYDYDSIRQQRVVNTSLGIAFYCSLIFGCLNYIFAESISLYLFNSFEYVTIFKVFAVTLVFTSLNGTLLSILNGYKKIKLFILVGILNNLIGLVMTYFLAVNYHVFGALLSVVLTQSIVCITTLLIVRKFEWFNFSFLKGKFDILTILNLSKYTLMALTSVCVVSVSQIIVRNYLTEYLSLDEAGYWQAVWKISEIYLMIITTSLSTYYLPRLSEINEKCELRKEIFRGYKILLPLTIAMAGVIYALREYIILILFTPKFMLMKDLFLFQLVGDVLKITSWLLAFLMLAKSMTRVFVITEIIFSMSFIGLTYLFVNSFGLIGITYAYALNYFFYLIMICVKMRKQLY